MNQGYFADGAGSGSWKKTQNTNLDGVTSSASSGYFLVANGTGGFTFIPAAHGSFYFSNIASPYTLSATTAYAKVAATSTAGGSPVAITEGTNSRLTYTGTNPVTIDLVFTASIDHAAETNRDITVALYKNGVAVDGSESVISIVSGHKTNISMHKDVTATASDYFEIFCKASASASINFYTINLMASTAGA